MTSPVAEKLITAEEFALMPDPEGACTELEAGKVVCMPPPSTIHGRFVRRLALRLSAFVEAGAFGEVFTESGYALSRNPDTVRGPDVSYLSNQRMSPQDLPSRGYVEGAPTLAIEVISPDERDDAVERKVGEYLDAGAERVWEVRPRLRTVTVHRTGQPPVTLGAGDTLTSDDAAFAVDGFSLPVAEIFA